MRIKPLFALLVVSFSLLLYAQNVARPGQYNRSLTAVTTTGGGTVFALPLNPAGGNAPNKFSWRTVIASGPATAVTVQLEGCGELACTTPINIFDTSTSTTSEVRNVSNKTAPFVRCNITSYTTNGSNLSCDIAFAY